MQLYMDLDFQLYRTQNKTPSYSIVWRHLVDKRRDTIVRVSILYTV